MIIPPHLFSSLDLILPSFLANFLLDLVQHMFSSLAYHHSLLEVRLGRKFLNLSYDHHRCRLCKICCLRKKILLLATSLILLLHNRSFMLLFLFSDLRNSCRTRRNVMSKQEDHLGYSCLE